MFCKPGGQNSGLWEGQMRSLLIGVLVLYVLGACYAAQEDDPWKRLENANKAREFYVQGEAAYKAGLWEAAAR